MTAFDKSCRFPYGEFYLKNLVKMSMSKVAAGRFGTCVFSVDFSARGIGLEDSNWRRARRGQGPGAFFWCGFYASEGIHMNVLHQVERGAAR